VFDLTDYLKKINLTGDGVWKEAYHRNWNSVRAWTEDLKILPDEVGKENV